MKVSFIFLHGLLMLFLIAQVIFPSKTNANLKKNLTITVEGRSQDVRYFKLRADLRMARNVDFCRGEFLPIPKSKWRCNPSTRARKRCFRRYACKRASRVFNRVVQTRYFLHQLKRLRKPNSKLRIWFSITPFTNEEEYKANSEYATSVRRKRRKKLAKAALHKKDGESFLERKRVKRPKKSTQKKTQQGNSVAGIETDDDWFADVNPKRSDDGLEDEFYGDDNSNMEEMDDIDFEEDEISIDSFEDDDENKGKNGKKSSKRSKLEFELDDDEEFNLDEDEDDDEQAKNRSNRSSSPSSFEFANFSFHGIYLIVDEINSGITAGGAWTPKLNISHSFSLEAFLGVHTYTIVDVGNFLILSSALMIDYRMRNIAALNKFSLSAGMLMESWRGEGGSSSIGLIGGAKYSLGDKNIINNLGVKAISISNVMEIHLGIGLKF